MNQIKVLILGASGMLGHKLFGELSKNRELSVYGTVRSIKGLDKCFSHDLLKMILPDITADNFETITSIISDLRPEIVINCIGIIKQLPAASDPITTISINALFPHRIAKICNKFGIRLIHISTDCVFDGKKGNYSEKDMSNAKDLYGRTKYLGELAYGNCLTLRSSIIGHELKSKYGLIEWFLSQKERVRGYCNAIYSGFPTLEIAHIINEYVIPNEKLAGLYHVSSDPISKYDLLKLVASKYGRIIEVEPFYDLNENRSLDSSLFRRFTGYVPPEWPELIDSMYNDYKLFYNQNKLE